MASPLFRYDRRVALNTIRATLAGWHDRMLASFLVLAALAGARAWMMDRSWPVAGWMGLGVGAAAGLAIARRLTARLAFHGEEGVLAADALCPTDRRRYLVAWHLIALAVVAVATGTIRPTLPIVTIPGYLLGALAGHGLGTRIAAGFGSARPAGGRVIRSWLRQPVAGGGAGLILSLAATLPLHALDAGLRAALVGLTATALALLLCGVDDAIVRLMAMTGWSAPKTIAYHARGALLFAGIAVPPCALMLGALPAVAIVAATAGALLLMTMRVLAYRLYPRRGADIVVSILIAVLILIGVGMTPILPLAAVALFWHLHRRAAGATWLVA